MKRMVFGLTLALSALGFLVSPVFAEGPRRQGVQELNAADRVFLASLASRAPKAPAAPVKHPSAGWEKALCGATAACGGGVTVSCTSNSAVTSCSAADRNCPEQGHVTCDGVTTWCPGTCPCSATALCGSGSSVSCSGSTSCATANRNCAAGVQGHVTCDGVTTSCSQACPPCSTTALCDGGTPVSCSGNSCSAADRDCTGTGDQGHVTCDGTTTWCSAGVCCSLNCYWGELDCAQTCGSCPYHYTCDEFSCTDSCRCDFRFCEAQ